MNARKPVCGHGSPGLGYELLGSYSLLSWSLSFLRSSSWQTLLLSSITSWLYTLWVTNLGDNRVKGQGQPADQFYSHEYSKVLIPLLINEFLYVLISLARSLARSHST